MFTEATFGDLYRYIQQAERDNVGYHFPFSKRNLFFHIYENKRQMNLNVNDFPVAVFLFRPEDNVVRLVTVDNGVADYSSPEYVIPMSTSIGINPTDANSYWFTKFGEEGRSIKEILRDALGPYIAKNTLQVPYKDNQPARVNLVDVMMAYQSFTRLVNELNDINASYPRYVGSLVMVSSDTEDKIENICNMIMDEIGTLESPEYLNVLKSVTDGDVTAALENVKSTISENLSEVARARDFLAKYYA